MKPVDHLLDALLKKTQVVPTGLEAAVLEVSREIWPDAQDDDLLLGGFRNGLLRLEVDCHARLAEAKTYHSETIRTRINACLARASRGTPQHVTKLVFHVRGTI